MTQVQHAHPKRRIVIALGGNAIIPDNREGSYEEQVRRTRLTMDQVAQLAAEGHSLVLTHGNGPVVGNILLRNDAGFEIHGIPRMPLYICGADSQGGIGYMIQQCLQNALGALGLSRPVVSVVTQVTVDENDPAFLRPTKPIGPFYDRERAKQLERSRGWSVVEDANRGWRRVVPSPRPREVVESEAIRTLYQDGVIAIAVGGGGVPVLRDPDGQLRGVAAVIDKDHASALLGKLIGADTLVIITSVDRVYRRFGKPDQEALDLLDLSAAEALVRDGEFPAGSMGPKIEAALSFLKSGGREVLITNPESLQAALNGQAGTRLVPVIS
jgi:carbamate kinase